MSAIVTEQKLLLLYFMDRCGTPLSSDQLTRHMLEQHWADYFQLQQMLLELGEARLVTRAEAFPRLYHLTDAGKETLALFNTQVPRYLKNQVNAFVRAHGQELAHETQVHAEYERIGSDEVMVTLENYEAEKLLFGLRVSVVSSEQAKLLCARFKQRSDEVYASVMQVLTRGED